jgi:hypothetical protein
MSVSQVSVQLNKLVDKCGNISDLNKRESMDNIIITDGLLKELNENFGPQGIRNAKLPEDFYKIKGYIEILDYLKDRQEELRLAQFENTEQITIDSS